METIIKEFIPGSSFNNNGISYFRLENGNIAVEKETNIVYDFSKDTIVEIIAVSEGFKIFRVNNTHYYSIAPCIKGYKILDSNIEFETFGEYINFYQKYYVDEEEKNKPIYIGNGFEILKVHCTDVYPEGRYVIYSDNLGYIGLFYLSDTEISDIFRPDRYIDIIFSKGYFFCKKKNDEFYIFSETLQYVGKTSSICEITKVTESVFYSNTTIFSNEGRAWSNFQVEVDEGIVSADIIRFDKLEIIKVLTKCGTTQFYSINCEYLCSCYNKVEIIGNNCFDNNRESCRIYDIIGEKIVAYYYIIMFQTDEFYKKKRYTCVPFAESRGFKVNEKSLPEAAIYGDKFLCCLYVTTRQNMYIDLFRGQLSRFEYFQDDNNIYFIIFKADDWISHILEFESRSIFKMKKYEVESIKQGFGRGTSIIITSGKVLIYSRYYGVILLTEGSNCWKEYYDQQSGYVIKNGEILRFYNSEGRFVRVIEK